MFISFKAGAAAIAFTAATLAAGAASASDFEPNGRTSEVRHGDLDLSRVQDRAALQRRIRAASLRVCANTDLAMQQACRAKAVAYVQPRVEAAIARADTKERYAEAAPAVRPVVGN